MRLMSRLKFLIACLLGLSVSACGSKGGAEKDVKNSEPVALVREYLGMGKPDGVYVFSSFGCQTNFNVATGIVEYTATILGEGKPGDPGALPDVTVDGVSMPRGKPSWGKKRFEYRHSLRARIRHPEGQIAHCVYHGVSGEIPFDIPMTPPRFEAFDSTHVSLGSDLILSLLGPTLDSHDEYLQVQIVSTDGFESIVARMTLGAPIQLTIDSTAMPGTGYELRATRVSCQPFSPHFDSVWECSEVHSAPIPITLVSGESMPHTY